MFTVNGSPILADEIAVLELLKLQSDKEIFHVFRPTGDNDIMTTCPFHKDGQERKPSFGISKVNMKCHCFSCGWAGMLDTMISAIFGHDDNGLYGREWLAKNFLTFTIETRKPLNLNLSRGAAVPIVAMPGFTEEELDKYRYTHPYMYKRGLNDALIQEFDIGYDAASDSITFPVYMVDGTPAFIARRSVKTKFFNYPKGVDKPVYAANFVQEQNCTEVIIVESFFNALTCWQYGRPAVALMGTGTSAQYEILRKLPVRKYIIATDGDFAGRLAARKLKTALTNKVVTFLDVPSGKDINDLGEYFLSLREYF